MEKKRSDGNGNKKTKYDNSLGRGYYFRVNPLKLTLKTRC